MIASLAAIVSLAAIAFTVWSATTAFERVREASRVAVEFEASIGRVERLQAAYFSALELAAETENPLTAAETVVRARNLKAAHDALHALVDRAGLPGHTISGEAAEARVIALADEARGALHDGRFAEARQRLNGVEFLGAVAADRVHTANRLLAQRGAIESALAHAKAQERSSMFTGLAAFAFSAALWLAGFQFLNRQTQRTRTAMAELGKANDALARHSAQQQVSFFEDSPLPMIELDGPGIEDAIARIEAAAEEGEDARHDAFTRAIAGLRVRRANAAAVAMFGVGDPEELNGRASRFFKAEFHDAFARFLADLRRGLTAFVDETVVHTWGQRSIDVVLNARAIRDGEAIERVVISFIDVTARKAATNALSAALTEAEAASKAKSEFLATMSHEIRTPLNGVLGMAAALAGSPLTPKQASMLKIIQDSGQSLLAVLNDILDISKIEAGRIELEEAPFDLDEVLDGAWALYEPIASKKGLHLDITVEPDARGRYVGDPTRVRQVLNNLLSNAVKFTERGEITVFVSREERDDRDGPVLRVTVRDTGVGIPEDKLERLFQPFSQADASTTRRYGGSGLGLAISKRLTEMMGGGVAVRSTPGRGSMFSFTVAVQDAPELPADVAPEAETAPEREGSAAAPAAVLEDAADDAQDERKGRTIRLLAAEDHPHNRLVLQALLEPMGVTTTFAVDGKEAVEAWSAEEFDLIFMDIQMPVMDGIEATKEIRRREVAESRARTPIVAVTANALSHQVASYLDAGMDGHVPKPIRPDKLLEAIRMSMELRAQQEEKRSAAG